MKQSILVIQSYNRAQWVSWGFVMEILHDDAVRRTVIVAIRENDDADVLCQMLESDFRIIRTDNTCDCLRIINERIAGVSAVIIDADLAQADNYAFFHDAAAQDLTSTIPVLVATTHRPSDADARCLEEGATDFITKPCHPTLAKRRIDNAIRIKRSTTFVEIETMLRQLPSNIFLKDTQGRYVFCTHYWHHLEMGDDPNWSIRGKTDLEIRKDRENALKAMEADREIVRTGKGTTYVIEINTDGIQEFMELIKQPVFDDEGNVSGIIALINDVTEAELLKRELEKRTRTDELTGLGNHRAYDQFVSTISNQSDFPIAVISADCDELKIINDTLGHLVGDEYIRMAAMIIKDTLPESAHVFRTGGDEFIAFLPKTTEEDAQGFVSKMRTTAGMFVLKDRKVSISYGTSFIGCADENVYDAISYADQAMYSNKAEHKRARR